MHVLALYENKNLKSVANIFFLASYATILVRSKSPCRYIYNPLGIQQTHWTTDIWGNKLHLHTNC